MEPAARRINHLQHLEGQEISIAVRRSHSARIESVGTRKTTTATLMNQNKPYHYPAQDGQIISNSNKPLNKSQVWDCGSSLYDSFELRSLQLQLDLAIKDSSRRTLSMPHLPERDAPGFISPPKPAVPVTTATIAKHQNVPEYFGRVSKSFHKILRSIFGSSKTVNAFATATSPFTKVKTYSGGQKGNLIVYDGSKSMRALTTIPEVQKIDDGHPKFSRDTPAVRRAASERFAASSVPVFCP